MFLESTSLLLTTACQQPTPYQWMAIVALITGSGVLIVVSATSLVALASTFATIAVPMIIAGATISEVITVITTGDFFALAGGIEALTGVIVSIMGILNCQ
ncbi:hypothetical protein GM3708_2880 [Geminocystis sp. NIES-3708]|uniref:hypothetical protein n=1 Tax=Geminocystis sp. NIES-3708 TaxID=1615909 RepID=UPI0005FC63AE|nr:hypothetical protein [Geminocystis sp. NIES-3708]BAQ62474.1 hypothetical protein GM3708_2880 [Geminocystis sp. NIES-3708]